MIRLKNNTKEQIRTQVKAIQHHQRRLRKKYNKHAHKLLSVSSSKIRRRIGSGSLMIKNNKYSYKNIFNRKTMTRKALSKRYSASKLKTEAAFKRAVAIAMDMAHTNKPLRRESYRKQSAKFKSWRKNKQTNIANLKVKIGRI